MTTGSSEFNLVSYCFSKLCMFLLRFIFSNVLNSDQPSGFLCCHDLYWACKDETDSLLKPVYLEQTCLQRLTKPTYKFTESSWSSAGKSTMGVFPLATYYSLHQGRKKPVNSELEGAHATINCEPRQNGISNKEKLFGCGVFFPPPPFPANWTF